MYHQNAIIIIWIPNKHSNIYKQCFWVGIFCVCPCISGSPKDRQKYTLWRWRSWEQVFENLIKIYTDIWHAQHSGKCYVHRVNNTSDWKWLRSCLILSFKWNNGSNLKFMKAVRSQILNPSAIKHVFNTEILLCQ